MKHYVYKITFEEDPHIYYGVRSNRDPNNDPYVGSPKTHKSYWEIYTPKKTILSVYRTREEAAKIEQELIRQNWKFGFCLNAHINGVFSLGASVKGGRRGGPKGGKNQPIEIKRSNGRKAIAKMPREAMQKGGKNTPPDVRRTNGLKGGRNTSSQVWQCLETGHSAPPGPLSRYQRARNIDPTNRIRIN